MGMTNYSWAKPVVPRNQQFLAVALDDSVPADHKIRAVDEVLGGIDWSPWEAEYESEERRGQPPIHPRLIAGCILYGMMLGIRSSRRLEEATRERKDFEWFLEGRTIDHTTLSKFRKRFMPFLEALNADFAKEVCKYYEKALEGLVTDGTRIQANSDRHGARTAESLERMIARYTEVLNERLKALGEQDEVDDEQSRTIADLEKEVEQLRKKIAQYETASEVAKDRDAQRRKKQGKGARPVSVPVTDPDSSIVPNKEGGYAPNYTPTVTIDEASGAIIAGYVPEGARESDAVMPAVEKAKELGGTPKRVMADTGFSGGENLRQLDEAGVEACMPTGTDFRPTNPANRDDPMQPVPEEQCDQLPTAGGKLRPSAFIYDAEHDEYRCPMGKVLTPERTGRRRNGAETVQYRCHECKLCPLAHRCLAKQSPGRTVARDQYQDLRDKTGRRMATEEETERYKKRAPLVEVVFARFKYHMGLRKFLLRGLENVRGEWNWACCAYNLKLLLKIIQGNAKATLQEA